MNDWLIPAVIILAVIGGLLVIGLAAIFLIVRSARSRPLATGDSEGPQPDRPITEDEARQITAQLKFMNSRPKDGL